MSLWNGTWCPAVSPWVIPYVLETTVYIMGSASAAIRRHCKIIIKDCPWPVGNRKNTFWPSQSIPYFPVQEKGFKFFNFNCSFTAVSALCQLLTFLHPTIIHTQELNQSWSLSEKLTYTPPAAGYQNELLRTNSQTGYGLDDSWACCNVGYGKCCLINY